MNKDEPFATPRAVVEDSHLHHLAQKAMDGVRSSAPGGATDLKDLATRDKITINKHVSSDEDGSDDDHKGTTQDNKEGSDNDRNVEEDVPMTFPQRVSSGILV